MQVDRNEALAARKDGPLISHERSITMEQGAGSMSYLEFLQSKIDIAEETGFEVEASAIHPALKPHQRDAVLWALKGGRRALFESFGLGKTIQQLEWSRMVCEHTGGRVLIILPLGVKQEFQLDAVRILGWKRGDAEQRREAEGEGTSSDPGGAGATFPKGEGFGVPPYVRTDAEAMMTDARILLTNYERVRDGQINPRRFDGVSLDEASCLRSYGSKTYQQFIQIMKGIPYKLVCTATPSPNRYKELIHYAGYLEIMDTGQALTRFFQRDSTKANNLTLYPHRENDFWLWVSSWALFIQKPSDLGYDDAGYDLPEMEVRWHCLPVDNATAGTDKHGQVKMIRDAAFSLQDAAREKRDSIGDRVAKMLEIVGSDPEAHFILWHDLESERHAIKKAIPEAVEVYGTQEYEERERRVIGFADGEFRLLATKKEISGQGCNFQRHCHRAIFLGIDYEFNDFIQAIHRIYRFLQTERVIIDIIYTESEAEIKKALLHKWKRHDEMVAAMIEIVKRYGLQNRARFDDMKRTIGVERVEVKGTNYRAINNDCVKELADVASMPDNSVDEIITSIPFGNHYEYTPSYNDFGHNPDTEKFFEQMDFLTPNLLRVLKPGRVYCCHVKDRVLFGNATGTGMPTMEPFHALTIEHCMKHGFQYFGMITVVTDVVRENNQTYRLGWTECCKDGSKMGVGCPEYILLFRKLPTDTSKAYADEPVTRSKEEYTRAQWQIDAHGFWRSSGDRLVSKEELMEIPTDRMQKVYREYSRGNVYSYAEHVALAKKMDAEGRLPATFMVVAPGSWNDSVWDDINRMRTLNTTQSQRRKQMHVCPLQIDIVDRLIDRYSNPGDTILDPFGGLMTVPVEAVKKGRKGIGVELNTDYFRDGVGYLEQADNERGMPTLFDFIDCGGIAQ
jgi:DNA modification methylase